MKLDLEKGTYLQIGGELGKYNSLPVDVLAKIAEHLQDLLFAIAKHDLPANEPINIDNFKIELVDFKKGSAVPKFAYTQRTENKTGVNWQINRNTVNEKFETLAEVSDSGDYGKIIELYPEPIKRNPIVESLFSFTKDFKTAPVNFVEIDEVTNDIKPIFKINKFKSSIKKSLLGKIIEEKKEPEEYYEGVAAIKFKTKEGKITNKKIIRTYQKDKYSLEFAPSILVFENTKYILKYPLRCKFEKEDDYFVIENELLSIIGTGLSEDDAELSFSEEFNFIYERLITLKDEQLSSTNRLTKLNLLKIIEKVEK